MKYKIEDYSNTTINSLTILREGEYQNDCGKKRRTFICRCKCGVEKEIQVKKIMNGKIKSCGGCKPDYVGLINGDLTILKEIPKKFSNRLLEVECKCGNIKTMTITLFNKKSHCGCKNPPKKLRELKELPKTKGVYVNISRYDTKGNVNVTCSNCGSKHILKYESINKEGKYCKLCSKPKPRVGVLTEDDYNLARRLMNIRLRCYDINNNDYKNYGARGINVCDEWLEPIYGVKKFRKWAYENGFKKDLTIDRIDNDRGYYPENCRWVSRSYNNDNRRYAEKYKNRVIWLM